MVADARGPGMHPPTPSGVPVVPVVPVRLALPGPAVDGATHVAVRDAASSVVTEHLHALGLPGRAEVTAERTDGPSALWGLWVHGERLRCTAEEAVRLVEDATEGRTSQIASVDGDVLVRVAAGLCTIALQSRLSALVGPAHLDLALSRPDSGASRDAHALRQVLTTVVDCGISLAAGAQDLAEIGSRSAVTHPVVLAEELITAGRAPVLDVVLQPDTLRSITSGEARDDDVFVDLRTALYRELGILGPDFRFAPTAGLGDRAFAFRLNAVRTWPDRLPTGAGLAAVADALAVAVRTRADWFISTDAVEEMTGRLALALPDTLEAVRALYPLEWLTGLTRVAVDEGTSLRHLATILDRLLDLDLHPHAELLRLREGGAYRSGVPIEALPHPRDAIALVRQQAAEERWRTGSSRPTTALELSTGLQRAVQALATEGRLRVGDVQAEHAAAQVRAMGHLAREHPLVADSLAVRAWLRESLRSEFPDLRVLARREIPPGADVRFVRAPDDV
ncbi:hypothetical protein [Cellulomonas sp. ATA003]|uniref:hypothetical protein n=1 Tax=Cellulomonas sp. ATA003 TaxID=3073064 RepID=UPI00287385D2|nr:hypothetical protein [Cellulomonas sp. ATA003]WNB87290.1 hypothetical protein REH70_09420 [Cellulomonas sp. ATA003]